MNLNCLTYMRCSQYILILKGQCFTNESIEIIYRIILAVRVNAVVLWACGPTGGFLRSIMCLCKLCRLFQAT